MADNFDLEKYLEEEATLKQDIDLESYLAEEEDQLQVPTEPEEMSKLEAFTEAATSMGGLRPIVTGAVSAGIEGLQDLIGDPTTRTLESLPADPTGKKFEVIEKEDMLDAFRSMRAKEAAKIRQAHEEQPAAAIGGSIADALLLGKLGSAITGTGKVAQATKAILPSAEGISKVPVLTKAAIAAREGTKAGALAELGTTEKETLPEALIETGKAGLAGGAIGSIVPLAGRAVKATKQVLGELPGVQTFKIRKRLAEAGISLDEVKLNQQVEKLGKQTYDQMSEDFNKLGVLKDEAMDLAENLGIKLNLNDFIDTRIRDINKIANNPEIAGFGKDNAVKFSKILKDLKVALDPFESKINQKKLNIEKLKDELENLSTKVPDSDIERFGRDTVREQIENITKSLSREENALSKLQARQPDVVAKDISVINRHLQDLSDEAGKLEKEASNKLQSMVRKLGVEINEKVQDTLEKSGIELPNKELSEMYRAAKLSKISLDPKKLKSELAKIDNVAQLEKFLNKSGVTGEIDKRNFFRFLKEANPEMSQKYDELERLSNLLMEARRQIRQTPEGATGLKPLFGKVGELTGQAKQEVTRVAKARKDNLSNMYNYLSGKTPDELLDLISKTKDVTTANKFHKVIENIAKAPTEKKNALLWAALQQPAFRQFSKEIVEGAAETAIDLVGDKDE
jgi:hypothetical protein